MFSGMKTINTHNVDSRRPRTLNPRTHGRALDAFGALGAPVRETAQAHGVWRAAVDNLAVHEARFAKAQEEEAFLRQAVEEFAAIAPQADDERSPADRRQRPPAKDSCSPFSPRPADPCSPS